MLGDLTSHQACRERVVPFFQPIISLNDESIVGWEILARWHDGTGKYLAPDIFLPAIGAAGLLDAMLDGLLEKALAAARDWPQDQFLAFNVSPEQIHRSELPERLVRIADAAGFPLSRVHIEVTETGILENPDDAANVLDGLIAKGCTIALDDFGTGFSSLSWLDSLPVATIKIDVRFVRSMLERKSSRKIVTAMVGLAHSLERSVIAEGVETREQANLLRKIGCGFAQGFAFSRPVPAEEAEILQRTGVAVGVAAQAQNLSFEQRAALVVSLYRSSEISAAFVTLDDRFIDVNDAFARRWGKEIGEILGKKVGDVVTTPYDLASYLRSFRLRGVKYPTLEIALPDGRTELAVFDRVVDEIGEPLGNSYFGIDITDRLKAEEAHCDCEENYRIATLMHPRVTWALDANGKMEWVEEGGASKFGINAEQMLGPKWFDIVLPEDQPHVREALTRSLTTGANYDVVMRYRRSDGSVMRVRSFMAPRRDETGQIIRWHGQSEEIAPG